MLPADGLAGSVTVIAADVVLTGYALPATAVKDAVWTDCQEMPPLAGVAQVPSPRQKVVADALVPPLRFVTGRLPVTPVVKGNPVALVNVAETGVPRAVTLPDALS
jgi:hypothetical protein